VEDLQATVAREARIQRSVRVQPRDPEVSATGEDDLPVRLERHAGAVVVVRGAARGQTGYLLALAGETGGERPVRVVAGDANVESTGSPDHHQFPVRLAH